VDAGGSAEVRDALARSEGEVAMLHRAVVVVEVVAAAGMLPEPVGEGAG